MIDRQRRRTFFDARHGRQRSHALPLPYFYIELAEIAGGLLEFRVHFQDDAILIELREHRRDLSLAKRVVQRVVDHLRCDAQSRG